MGRQHYDRARFRSLKIEQIYPNEYASPRELRVLINKYVEEYNKIRPHEALDYQASDDVYFLMMYTMEF